MEVVTARCGTVGKLLNIGIKRLVADNAVSLYCLTAWLEKIAEKR
jgi:hypothetical protein